MPNARKKTAELIEKTTGSKKKAEEYLRKTQATIDKVKEIFKTPIDPIYRDVLIKIDDSMRDSKYLLYILHKLMNVDQAKIVLALPDKYRVAAEGKASLDPADIKVTEQFARDLGMDKKAVDEYLLDLYYKGVVLPTRKGWQPPRSYMQFKDSASNNPRAHEPLGEEYFELWAAFLEEEGNDIRFVGLKRVREAGAAFNRIIPRYQSIKDIPGVLPFENIMAILEGADILSLTNCPCRKGYNNRTCDISIDSCINFGRTAEHNINRGSGRKVSLDEVMKIFAELDTKPMIHMVVNKRDITMGMLCNCHWDCCAPLQALYTQSDLKTTDVVAKSRFEAVLDADKCVGCKKCLSLCFFEAIDMVPDPGTGKLKSTLDVEKCMGCGCCVVNCPTGARTMKLVRSPEHVPE
ncbi:MAG: 4Fe-4S dicluster domain-containing protein [Dehalococcoidales bacterium]|nr:4Fe-4S dicluster domain-containing protein [Dehalococcoidales bacterium]